MLGNIGSTEIIIIAIVVLILFGGKKLPEMGKGLGESFREFKKAFGSKEKKKKKSTSDQSTD
jgi:sec-independent protein translocase protein TatA